jgi:maltose alpha-D-glucosyltransferase/alpha-amylase
MSNFFYFQPALNYGWPEPQYDWQLPTDHPDVMAMKAEMRDIMRFWLDMGASGFRVDMAASLVKGDPDNSATMEYWEGVRKWMDEEYPGAVIISEWSCPKQAIHCGFHIDFMIHSGTEVYTSLFRKEDGRNVFPGEGNSFFDRRGRGDIREFLDVYLDHYQATKDNGYISIPSGNHDLPRLNCGRSEKELRVAFAFVLTMPGVPTIYYGDEIGMRHITGLTSKEGGYVRTGARTPMQWDKTENAGFSRARPKELYLPIDREPDRPTVAEQEGEADSLLQLVRRLVRLRRNNEALKAYGRFIELYAEAGGYPFVYARFSGAQTVIVGVNPADREQTCFVSKAKIDRMPETLIEGAGGIVEEDDGWTFNMPPISFAIWG